MLVLYTDGVYDGIREEKISLSAPAEDIVSFLEENPYATFKIEEDG